MHKIDITSGGIGEGCSQLSIFLLQGNSTFDFPNMLHKLKNTQVLGISLRINCDMGRKQGAITIYGTQYSLPNKW